MASACGTGQNTSRWFCRSPQPHTTTRANISHEIAEQIRARIVCTPAESAWRAWSDTYADETIKISPISLCSHPDTHPNLNREVCHSPTWHSSKSESALERFEPIAAAMLWSDGQGTLFAPVAARRQKVFKRGKHSSFCPFRSFRTSEKNNKRKVSLCFLRANNVRPPCTFSRSHARAACIAYIALAP